MTDHELHQAIERLEAVAEKLDGIAVRLPPHERPGSTDQIAAEALNLLVASGCRSKLMKLPEATLEALARRLAARANSRGLADAHDWLNSVAERPVPHTSFYRFATRYRAAHRAVVSPLLNALERAGQPARIP